MSLTGTPESWSFFTSDLSGYVMSFENGKVIQAKTISPILQVEGINTTYTGKPFDASIACVSASAKANGCGEQRRRRMCQTADIIG